MSPPRGGVLQPGGSSSSDERGQVRAGETVLVLGSLLVGGIAGSLLRLESRIEGLGGEVSAEGGRYGSSQLAGNVGGGRP